MLRRVFICSVVLGVLSLALSTFTASAQSQSEGEGYIIEHTIEKGQFLNRIVKMYNTSTAKILELNPGLEPDKIRAGQKIRIQPNSNSSTANPTTTNAEANKRRAIAEEKPITEKRPAIEEKPITDEEKPVVEKRPAKESKPAATEEKRGEEGVATETQPTKREELVSTTEYIEHTVAKGERFSHIVVNYHTTTVKLLQYNPGLVPARVVAGDKIKIPVIVYKRVEVSTDETPSDGTYHTVVSGDTLNKIARTYETTVAKIRELNSIENDDHIRIGQRLRVK